MSSNTDDPATSIGARANRGGSSTTSAKSASAQSSRTVFVLHEAGGATKALRVSLIWVVIGIFMATADALSPKTFIQVSAWLSLFFLGVMLSFWALFNLSRAAAATGALIGTFLGPYSLTWQLWVMYVKHWKDIFPVRLFPFPIILDEFQWYAMMGVGFFLFCLSIAALAHLSRPRSSLVQIHHDSGEAVRLGDPP